MRQLTLRVPDDLADQLKQAAANRGRSVNAFATDGLKALVDPDSAGDEIERLRERLRRAGILAELEPTAKQPPDHGLLARARADAGRGKPLSDLVSEGRR